MQTQIHVQHIPCLSTASNKIKLSTVHFFSQNLIRQDKIKPHSLYTIRRLFHTGSSVIVKCLQFIGVEYRLVGEKASEVKHVQAVPKWLEMDYEEGFLTQYEKQKCGNFWRFGFR